jgi:hypothetical protein
MPSVFDKLNFKGQQEILVLNAPPDFEHELSRLTEVLVHRNPGAVKEISFSLVFVTRRQEVDAFAKALTPKAKGDAILWFAYPKGTSKRYRCDFNRDSGWDALGAAGFEGVRLVAIDEDWSALRFRRVEFIKSLHRDPKRAMSSAGKKRAARRP